MKKLIIIFIFLTTPLFAAKVERLGFYNIQELLEDDNLTFKIIKSCVSLNSAITEITKEDYPDLSKSFFATANYLYPFGILTLAKIKKMNYQDVEKEYLESVSTQVNDYMDFMKENGVEETQGSKESKKSKIPKFKKKEKKKSKIPKFKKSE